MAAKRHRAVVADLDSDMHPLPIAYSVIIFLALALGGLAIVRTQRNVTLRAILFVLLCFTCVKGSFWLALRWGLDAVELGVAWGAVLLIVAVVEAIRFQRSKRSPA